MNSLLTRSALDGIGCLGCQYTVVVFIGVESFEQESWHAVRKHPEVSVAVDLQIVGEDQCIAVRVDQTLSVNGIILLDVPAANGVLVHLRIEKNVGVLVKMLGCGLSIGATIAKVFVVEIGSWTGGVGLILQHLVRYLELFRAGQCVEVH